MVNAKKLFKTALEGVVSSSLVATMLLTQLNLSVKAVTPTTPSSGKFIPKSALETTDTEFGLCTGKTVQKVYFGHNPHFNKVTGTRSTASDLIPLKSGAAPAEQGWFIAGSQATGYGANGTNGGLVLLCDPLQPMIDASVTDTYGGMPFLAESKYKGSGKTGTFNKTGYSQSWGCTYANDAPAEGSQVYANHFGGSDIWKKIKEYQVQEDRFTSAEQSKMENTTGWTYDDKNDKFYSTRSKLYLGAGEYSDDAEASNHYFTVGANEVDTTDSKTKNNATNNGLKVGLVAETGSEGSPYISGGQWFWLRSPHAGSSNIALGASTGYDVCGKPVRSRYRCVPAFALNLESVIFASAAAPAAASSSAFSDGVYLRFADDENRLDTTASTSGNTLTVARGSGNGDVYLYIQGNDDTNDWVYSKKITGAATLSANDIHNGLENLSDCKVWVETTKDNVTYAKEIEVSAATTQVKLEGSCPVPVHIALQDNMGRAITGTDAAGITLEIDATTLSEDTTNGIFKSASLPEGSYTLTVTVDEDSSKYIAPKVTKYTVKNGIDDLGNIKVTTIRLEQKVVEIGRVLSGVGGDAGYRYDKKTGETVFYCNPAKGYKVDKIEKDSKGVVKYVRFKIL